MILIFSHTYVQAEMFISDLRIANPNLTKENILIASRHIFPKHLNHRGDVIFLPDWDYRVGNHYVNDIHDRIAHGAFIDKTTEYKKLYLNHFNT